MKKTKRTRKPPGGHDFQRRRERLQKKLRQEGLDALLVTSFVNVRYLTGFTGDDSYLLVRRDGVTLLSDSRYETQLAEECPGLDVESRRAPTPMLALIEKTVKRARLQKLGVEGDVITVSVRDGIAEQLPDRQLVPTQGLVEAMRQIKDRSEVEAIRVSLRVAEKAFAVIRAGLRGEQTECEIAYELEHQIRLLGGQGCSFPPIVAAGPRAALPHARPQSRRIGDDSLLLIDWGAVWQGYMCDLTRVLVTAKISPKLERIYGVVLNAQQRAIDAIRPGATLGEVDAAARRVIEDAGFGRRFGHGLGHGFGLEIHESPRMAPGQQEPLKAGMVVTVEPGIYLPDWGGVRIEDDVLVTPSGGEVLSEVPKQLSDCMVA